MKGKRIYKLAKKVNTSGASICERSLQARVRRPYSFQGLEREGLKINGGAKKKRVKAVTR